MPSTELDGDEDSNPAEDAGGMLDFMVKLTDRWLPSSGQYCRIALVSATTACQRIVTDLADSQISFGVEKQQGIHIEIAVNS